METLAAQSDPQLSDSRYIETAVLGCMILDPKYIPMIRAIIMSPLYFQYPEHQVVFRVACDAWDEHSDEDTMMMQIRQMLDSSGQISQIGGVEYLIKIVESVPSSASWKYYCNILRDQHTRRELFRCSNKIMQISKSDESVDVCLSKAQDLIRRVVVEEAKAEAVSSLTDITEVLSTFSKEEYIPTGIGSLDKAIRGVKGGEVIIIAARTAMGKTILAMDFAINMMKADHPVMIFSLEMGTVELKQRIVCNQTRVNSDVYINGYASQDQIIRANKQLGELSTKPLYIDASPRLTPSLFHAKVIQYKAKYNIEVVVVDYLTLMEADRRCSGYYEKFSEIINELKRVCKEEDVALILVCQLNRTPESRTDKRPNMGDIRDSGAIEQNADVIMLLYRDDYYDYTDTGTAEIIIAKVRRGRPQTVNIRFHGSYTKFEDI